MVSAKSFAYWLTLEEARETRVIRKTSLNVLPAESDDHQGAVELIQNKIHEIQREKNENAPLPNSIAHMAIAIAKDIPSATTPVESWNDRFGNGDTAIGYHSEVPKYRRERIMKRIKNNEINLLVVVDML